MGVLIEERIFSKALSDLLGHRVSARYSSVDGSAGTQEKHFTHGVASGHGFGNANRFAKWVTAVKPLNAAGGMLLRSPPRLRATVFQIVRCLCSLTECKIRHCRRGGFQVGARVGAIGEMRLRP